MILKKSSYIVISYRPPLVFFCDEVFFSLLFLQVSNFCGLHITQVV
jgi:hypothetical protein